LRNVVRCKEREYVGVMVKEVNIHGGILWSGVNVRVSRANGLARAGGGDGQSCLTSQNKKEQRTGMGVKAAFGPTGGLRRSEGR